MSEHFFIHERGKTRLLPKNPAQLRYAEYLRSPRWRWIVRPLRVWVDGHKCVTCEVTHGLQVHQPPSAYATRGNGEGAFWEHPLHNLLDIVLDPLGIVLEIYRTKTLCDKCHAGVHWAKLENR